MKNLWDEFGSLLEVKFSISDVNPDESDMDGFNFLSRNSYPIKCRYVTYFLGAGFTEDLETAAAHSGTTIDVDLAISFWFSSIVDIRPDESLKIRVR